MRMKWSNENFMRQCEIADKKLEYERELTIIDEYALNLRDCRDMYSRLENYGRTQFCLLCERHARRVAELEAQLAEARRDGERLDLIESRYLCVSYLSMNSKWDVLTNEAHPAHRKKYQRKSLRAAIDAAAAEAEGEKG